MAEVAAAAEVQLRVGRWAAPLGPVRIVEALRATIIYRLEPESQLRRYPAVLRELFDGRLAPDRAAAAAIELQEISRRLGALPPRDAVRSLADLRRLDDLREPVNHRAGHLAGFFVAADGRPMLAVLAEAVQRCGAEGRPLRLENPTRDAVWLVGAFFTLSGLAWTVLAYLYLPDVALGFGQGEDLAPAQHGMPVWAVGLCWTSIGLQELAVAASPGLDELRKRYRVPWFVLLAFGWFLLAWSTWL